MVSIAQENQLQVAQESAHTVYLTFDDGPSTTTDRVLDCLKQEGVRGTFFVTGATTEHGKALYLRILAEGHALGIHSYSHNFEKIYASSRAYLDDFEQLAEWIVKITNTSPKICRMPGGSSVCPSWMKAEIFAYFEQHGYTSYNWNIDPEDSIGPMLSSEVLANRVIRQAEKKPDQDLIILLHDNTTNNSLPQALPTVIAYFRNKGYLFAVLV